MYCTKSLTPRECLKFNGDIASVGMKHLVRNQKFEGSIPSISTVLSRVRVSLKNSRVRDTLSATGIASVYPLR